MLSVQNSKPTILTINEKIKIKNINIDLTVLSNSKRLFSNNYLLIIYF